MVAHVRASLSRIVPRSAAAALLVMTKKCVCLGPNHIWPTWDQIMNKKKRFKKAPGVELPNTCVSIFNAVTFKMRLLLLRQTQALGSRGHDGQRPIGNVTAVEGISRQATLELGWGCGASTMKHMRCRIRVRVNYCSV